MATHRNRGDRNAVLRLRGRPKVLHIFSDSMRVVTSQMELSRLVCAHEREDPAIQDVLVGWIPRLVTDGEEERLRDGRQGCELLSRTNPPISALLTCIRHPQTQNAIDSVKVLRVALRDAAELGLGIVPAKLRDVLSYVSTKTSSIRIGETEPNEENMSKGQALRWMKRIGCVHHEHCRTAIDIYNLSSMACRCCHQEQACYLPTHLVQRHLSLCQQVNGGNIQLCPSYMSLTSLNFFARYS